MRYDDRSSGSQPPALRGLFDFFIYFALLLVLAAGITGPVVLGNPVPWILLRIAAITVIVMYIWTL